MKYVRMLIGLALCAAPLGAIGPLLQNHFAAPQVRTRPWSTVLWEYWTAPMRELELEFPTEIELGVTDPIFARHADGHLEQVGEIRALVASGRISSERRALVSEARARFYPEAAPLDAGARLVCHPSPDSLVSLMETLLTPERKAELLAELRQGLAEHQTEIITGLRPVLEASFEDAWQVAVEDFPKAWDRRRERIAGIGTRLERDLIEKEMLPLAKSELWPLVRHRGEPVAKEIVRELWDKTSLWRFGWRLAYDQLPVSQTSLTEKEWQRFLQEDGMPIFQKHSDDFVLVVRQVLMDAANNKRLAEGTRHAVEQLASDPEVQALVTDLLRETMIDNPRMHEALYRRWQSAPTQAAIEETVQRLEPTLRRMGDMLFGTRDKGISPEFALVLRNQVLGKDRCWFILEADGETTGSSSSAHAVPVRKVLVELGAPLSRPLLVRP